VGLLVSLCFFDGGLKAQPAPSRWARLAVLRIVLVRLLLALPCGCWRPLAWRAELAVGGRCSSAIVLWQPAPRWSAPLGCSSAASRPPLERCLKRRPVLDHFAAVLAAAAELVLRWSWAAGSNSVSTWFDSPRWPVVVIGLSVACLLSRPAAPPAGGFPPVACALQLTLGTPSFLMFSCEVLAARVGLARPPCCWLDGGSPLTQARFRPSFETLIRQLAQLAVKHFVPPAGRRLSPGRELSPPRFVRGPACWR